MGSFSAILLQCDISSHSHHTDITVAVWRIRPDLYSDELTYRPNVMNQSITLSVASFGQLQQYRCNLETVPWNLQGTWAISTAGFLGLLCPPLRSLSVTVGQWTFRHLVNPSVPRKKVKQMKVFANLWRTLDQGTQRAYFFEWFSFISWWNPEGLRHAGSHFWIRTCIPRGSRLVGLASAKVDFFARYLERVQIKRVAGLNKSDRMWLKPAPLKEGSNRSKGRNREVLDWET